MSDWVKHDGETCPVPPGTIVRIPGGTYAQPYFQGPASNFEWDNSKVHHLRDEIQHYLVIEDNPLDN